MDYLQQERHIRITSTETSSPEDDIFDRGRQNSKNIALLDILKAYCDVIVYLSIFRGLKVEGRTEKKLTMAN